MHKILTEYEGYNNEQPQGARNFVLNFDFGVFTDTIDRGAGIVSSLRVYGHEIRQTDYAILFLYQICKCFKLAEIQLIGFSQTEGLGCH